MPKQQGKASISPPGPRGDAPGLFFFTRFPTAALCAPAVLAGHKALGDEVRPRDGRAYRHHIGPGIQHCLQVGQLPNMSLAVHRKVHSLFQLAYQPHIRFFPLSVQAAAGVAAEGGGDDVHKARPGHSHTLFQGSQVCHDGNVRPQPAHLTQQLLQLCKPALGAQGAVKAKHVGPGLHHFFRTLQRRGDVDGVKGVLSFGKILVNTHDRLTGDGAYGPDILRPARAQALGPAHQHTLCHYAHVLRAVQRCIFIGLHADDSFAHQPFYHRFHGAPPVKASRLSTWTPS